MRRFWIFCLFAGMIVSQSFAQSFYFKKYQVENGLSHNTVWCILQDSYGFMWFGTSDGLNRFDGKQFKIFRSDHQEKFSLGNNSVQALFEDSERNIWVGTSEGIHIYQRLSGRFLPFDKKTQYNVSISSEVKKIIQTGKGQIWIATLGQGIFIYDPKTNVLTQNSLYTSFVWDICEDQTYRICTSSLQEGLICYDQNGNYLDAYSPVSDRKENLRISCIRMADEKVWFSMGVNMLCSLNSRTKQIEQYSSGRQHIGTIRAIAKYSEKELLIGSDNGLYLFHIQEGQFTRIDNLLNPRSLSDQSISAIVEDAEGGFWISTYLGGVNYLPKQAIVFNYYPPTHDPNSCTGKVISRFCENSDGNIWIGCQDGLKLLDITTLTAKSYPIPGTTQKLDIRSLLLDDDRLWIGTYANGLKVLDLKKNKLTEYNHTRNSATTICSNDVLSLYRDREGNIYAGTTWGLCRYNRLLDHFETMNFVGTMTSVFDILEDQSGYLWIATDNAGAFRFDPKNNQWKHYVWEENRSGSITSNSIITLHKDLNGRIWLGTNGGGLCYFDEGSESFIDFDPQNQILSSKVIYAIEEDILGNFWISGNAGLLRVDPSDKTNLKLFTQEDGLQSNQFNFRASLKSGTDMLYFGGINGFNSFFPNDFVENRFIPPVYIVDARLYNIREKESEQVLNLDGPVYTAKEIRLSYGNNSLTFSFRALSYEQPDKNRYQYVLEGFDKNWVDNGHADFASYTNLPAGEYVFRVKGTNNDYKWNEEGASIRLTILPPWWRSVYAYWAYFLMTVGTGYLVYRYLTAKARIKFTRRLEDYQVKTEKEAYQSKILFFVNLVHEIRTPLSLIKLPLERLSEENAGTRGSKYLAVINRNVDYLLHVANQLLDFQKIENQGANLDLRPHSLHELVRELHDQIGYSAALKQIDINLLLPENDVVAAIDREKIYKILINLVGNAVKHARTKIELHLEIFDDHFEIRVVDDGPGIPDQEKKKVFEAFYQSDNPQSSPGTGIGLAFSKSLADNHHGQITVKDNEWNGASFVLSIPFLSGKEELFPANKELPAAGIRELVDDRVPGEAETPDAPFKNARILLVEDNSELLDMIEDSLKSYFTVLKAHNGQQALDILPEETIDLIVSDVMMPEMDGFELCKAVKNDINYSHIPVILLTAKVALDSKIEGMEYGADVYLEKPFSMRYLRKQVGNLLQLKISFQKLLAADPSRAVASMPVPKRDKEFLERLHEKIEEHIAELDFSIDHIAETMFMSRSSFYRKIKNITGMTPNDYLRVLRLNKAGELLLRGDYAISEICARTGFSSSSYFARCFKARFGVLPKDYVAENEEK
ncbi:hybrid sensor histidine kinase/response regulator transcription factor [Gaoshiqia sp. Z1-71]|uniref:hybrid sensor histidine kinase/response regulator transcription factor n=1 Tax=Gaoshiqia hydrogeniformans TaxID=3290090 RepID=UPI003BF8DF82